MHIITGLIMASLLKRGQEDGTSASPLLRMVSPVRTLHLLPGRARFAVKRLQGDEPMAGKLTDALTRVEAIEEVRVSPVTGSVLVQYDADRISADLLVAAIIKVLQLEGELDRPPSSVVGRELREISHAMNRAVYDRTGGILDLRTALFLSLAALGTTRLWRQGSLSLPAGFTLLWWAGNGLLGRRGESACST